MKHSFLNLFYKIIFFCTFLSFPALLYAQSKEYKLIHKGNMEFRAKHYDKAATIYMQALKTNPNNARALFNLADTYLAKGDPKAADSLYNKVTQIEKNSQIKSMAWHNRGYICQTEALHNQEQQQQLLRQAIDYYKQALRLNPNDNDTRYNLVLCQHQLKNDKNNQSQQNQQQKQQQQKKNEQNQKEKQQDKQEQQNQQQKQQQQQQTERYINLARQAEQRALQKLKGQQPRQKSLDKNW